MTTEKKKTNANDKNGRRHNMALRWVSVVLLVPVVLALAWLAFTSARRVLVERRPPRAIAPMSGHWLRAADAELFIQEWGAHQESTVLLVHGTGAWSGTWFDTPAALAEMGWHVVAVDLPPFGFSRVAGPVDYSRNAQAQRLLALIKALGQTPVVIVGHSFGAGPALEAALRGGKRWVKQLVLVDPALGLGPHGEPPACSAPSLAEHMMGWRSLRTMVVSAAVTPPWFSAYWLRQFVSREEAVTPQRVSAYQIPFSRESFSESLGDWAVAFARSGCESALSLHPQELTQRLRDGPPVTLLWGEQDRVTPLAQAQTLQKQLSEARLVALPGVGHIPHIEDPNRFQAALAEVLQP